MPMESLDYHKQNASCRGRIVLVGPALDRLARIPQMRFKQVLQDSFTVTDYPGSEFNDGIG